MPNIRIDLLKHVRASRVSLLLDRQPDAVDLMIQRADADAVGLASEGIGEMGARVATNKAMMGVICNPISGDSDFRIRSFCVSCG